MKVSVIGLDALENVLAEIAPKQAQNLMRATVYSVASKVGKSAKKKAPKKTGNLRKAIKTKRKKSPPDRPVSEVSVEHGKNAKSDAFYWHFHEYGTSKMQATPFILPAKEEVLSNATALLREEFGKKLEKAMAKAARG